MLSSAVSINIKDHIPEFTDEVRKQLNVGLRVVGQKAAEKARKLCPKDTGHLRNSIKPKVDSYKKVSIGSPVEYAPYVEFGDKYTHAAGTQAHFLRDAIVKHRNIYMAEIVSALKVLE